MGVLLLSIRSVRLKPLPGDRQGGQECETTEANGDGKSGFEAVHISDKDARELLRCEDVAELRSTSGYQLHRIDTGSGHGQLNGRLIKKGSLGRRDCEGTSHCLENYEAYRQIFQALNGAIA